ncbi:MAG: NADH-quinone oxidoreductase subunit M [Candidatus Omnitrophica bacterium]|nr:NADH-quinone oxidoreductase subunit M [Candidatus Omnitrophota bacterium]
MIPLLSSIIFLPLVGVLLVALTPSRLDKCIKYTGLLITGLGLLLSIYLVMCFDKTKSSMQFVEYCPWLTGLNISYHLGVDGLSLALIFLTALLGFIACLASLNIQEKVKEYFIFYFLLMVGMFGTFMALDLMLFYIFWETVLIPMYFLIGIWGGPRREYAAVKFFLYTLAGSVLMLLSILTVYFLAQPHTFDILKLSSVGFDPHWQMVLFLGFFVAFAVKVPLFPFHTWLPDAHVEAPTPVSVLLAGVLLKMGGYGIFRICLPFFKDAAHNLAPALAIFAVINIVYGACVAMAQTDFKKMVAYSSVSHMGFVILGVAALNSTGFNGAVLEMFNHGIITGGMFLMVGVLYDRAHTRDLSQFGGLSSSMPFYAFCLTFLSLASLGLPGLSGFVGEFLSLVGAFGHYPWLVVLAAIGLIVGVAYFLYMLQRVLLGTLNPKCVSYGDMTALDLISVVPLIIITFIVGFYPQIVLTFQQVTINGIAHLF